MSEEQKPLRHSGTTSGQDIIITEQLPGMPDGVTTSQIMDTPQSPTHQPSAATSPPSQPKRAAASTSTSSLTRQSVKLQSTSSPMLQPTELTQTSPTQLSSPSPSPSHSLKQDVHSTPSSPTLHPPTHTQPEVSIHEPVISPQPTELELSTSETTSGGMDYLTGAGAGALGGEEDGGMDRMSLLSGFGTKSMSPSIMSQDGGHTLSVPSSYGGGRRHSLASSTVTSGEAGAPLATLGTPRSLAPPRSPGAHSNWSELMRLADAPATPRSQSRVDSCASFHSEESNRSMSGLSTALSQHMRELVQRFNSRTERFKERTLQPPTPSTGSPGAKSGVSGVSELEPPPLRAHRLDSFMPMGSRTSHQADREEVFIGFGSCKLKLPNFLLALKFPSTIDPTSRLYMLWLWLITLAYFYNAAAIPLRGCFRKAAFAEPEVRVVPVTVQTCDNDTLIRNGSLRDTASLILGNETVLNSNATCRVEIEYQEQNVTRYYPGVESEENRIYWWAVDYFCDLLFLLDIILIKNRVRFINNGLLEKDKKECMKNYLQKSNFKFDCACLLPLDLFYLVPYFDYNSLWRFPRLLKIQSFWEFWDRIDQSVSNPHIIRVLRTLTYMLFLIHVESCGYYVVSAYQTLRVNRWVYNGDGQAYIRCVYLATKTATSIGNNPRPTNELEFGFMTVYWLSGVFVFAMLIGQIRDIFQAANLAKTNYRETMDKTLNYMHNLSLPKDLQFKVRSWFNYNWEHQKTLNENLLLEALPRKMKADLAIHVHFNTLSKVQLFQDCDKNLLFDLVLKLKPVLYVPQDYICRKGEVGTEMYIVMMGQVEVVGGPNNSLVFATLHEGSVFGEISLLALAGGNRRTADVRSKGFSQLFILSKADFEEAMSDYPEAQKILKRRAKKLLNKNKKIEEENKMEGEEVIRSRAATPKLIRTVVQVIPPESHIHHLLGGPEEAQNHQASMYDEEDEILVVERTENPIPEEKPAVPGEVNKSPPSGSELLNNDALAAAILDQPPSPTSSQPGCSSLLSTDSDAPSTPSRRRKTKTKSRSRPSSSPLLGRAGKIAASPLLNRGRKTPTPESDNGGGGSSHSPSQKGSPRKSPKKRASMPVSLAPDSGDENLVTFTAEVHCGERRSPSPCCDIIREGVDNPAFVASDSGYALNSKLHLEMTNDETSF